MRLNPGYLLKYFFTLALKDQNLTPLVQLNFFKNFGIYEIELPVRKPFWEFHTNLTTIRDRSSSISIRNSTTLWITGGEDLWSSELVGLDKTVQSGPNIPSKALYY